MTLNKHKGVTLALNLNFILFVLVNTVSVAACLRNGQLFCADVIWEMHLFYAFECYCCANEASVRTVLVLDADSL